MKLLTAPGVVLIKSSAGFKRSTLHDAWPAHANMVGIFTADECASGQWVAVTAFFLKDGTEFFYLIGTAPDEAGAQTLIRGYQTYTTPDGIHGAVGEYYNFVQRPKTLMKLTGEQFTDYLLTH